tara:strand:+ start:788 stop:1357 length:570 start_codon:yes stop_codon:yes gene_type:complete
LIEISKTDKLKGRLRHYNSMEISKAAELIRFNFPDEIQLWADLGCGSGTFTYALATHLSANSTIYAMDLTSNQLVDSYANVSIEFIQSDFTSGIQLLPELHGVLMANSLHFMEDKRVFLSQLKMKLTSGRRQLLLVEYDTDNGNAWVPFPVSYSSLQKLMAIVGCIKLEKIGEMPSAYQGSMYAALISF